MMAPREADRASALLADLLKDGPRRAAEILASAEGANISARTMQRATTVLGVAKSRAAFRGGWMWALAAPQEGRPAPSIGLRAAIEPVCSMTERAEVIAARLRKFEAGRGKVAPIHAGDPRLMRWVRAGISDPELREAYELAVFSLERQRKPGPVTVGVLAPFVEQLAGGAGSS